MTHRLCVIGIHFRSENSALTITPSWSEAEVLLNRSACYFFSTGIASWEISRHLCQQVGDLVKIDSREEQV
uniref:C-type lectin domain-containing protein n=1 Tax=Lates calcarifer TaxID=8187 RepID=A0A4W6DAY8_LATCA